MNKVAPGTIVKWSGNFHWHDPDLEWAVLQLQEGDAWTIRNLTTGEHALLLEEDVYLAEEFSTSYTQWRIQCHTKEIAIDLAE